MSHYGRNENGSQLLGVGQGLFHVRFVSLENALVPALPASFVASIAGVVMILAGGAALQLAAPGNPKFLDH
jgi:hypothetical protein